MEIYIQISLIIMVVLIKLLFIKDQNLQHFSDTYDSALKDSKFKTWYYIMVRYNGEALDSELEDTGLEDTVLILGCVTIVK